MMWGFFTDPQTGACTNLIENNIDDNIIENISLNLDDESINTKARVTEATDM